MLKMTVTFTSPAGDVSISNDLVGDAQLVAGSQAALGAALQSCAPDADLTTPEGFRAASAAMHQAIYQMMRLRGIEFAELVGSRVDAQRRHAAQLAADAAAAQMFKIDGVPVAEIGGGA